MELEHFEPQSEGPGKKMNPGTKPILSANLDNVSVILVNPQHPGNIGAAARAMKNMRVHHMAMVRPHTELTELSIQMACGADDILQNARSYDSLGDAMATAAITVATSARRGRRRKDSLSPREMAELIAPLTLDNRVALVFGPESSGLSNEDIEHCQYVTCIPTDLAFSSLNLAQAVLLLCYEMNMATFPKRQRKRVLAPQIELDGMFEHVRDALSRIGFLPSDDPERMMLVLKRIFARAGLDSRESRIIRGIMRQINWYRRAGAPVEEGPKDSGS